MSALLAMWRDNPVMVKEFRVRMRGARAYWIITGYLLFLSFILFMQYTIWWNRTQAEGHNLASGSKIGQDFLMWITVTQAFLVAFITPAITSGAITIEREQRTLEMLELTRLSPGQVVLGKLSSAVGFVILLLISSLPLASICFFLGGVSPEQIGNTYLMLAAGAFVAGTLGLVWSAVARTTAAAVVLTYASLLAPFVLLIILGLMTSTTGPGFDVQLAIDHILAVFGIPMAGEEYSPIAQYYVYWDHVRFYGLTVPRWLPGIVSFGLIGLVLAAATAVRLAARPEKRSALLRWLVVFLFVEQMFFFFGARFCPYAAGAPVGIAQMMTGYPVLMHMLYPVMLLLIATPVFSTGDLRSAEARSIGRFILRGWKKLGWGTARLSAGWPYLCVLALVIVGMFAASFVFVGHGAEAGSGRISATATSTPPVAAAPVMPPGATAFGRPTKAAQAIPQSTGALVEIAIMLVATVTGLFFLGLLLSVMCGNRWVAMMLMYVAILMILVGPFVSYMNFRMAGAGASPSIFINLFYLNPIFAILQMCDLTGSTWAKVPVMFGATPAWQVTTVVYGIIALAAIALSLPFVTRTAAQPVLAYEEIGARA
jgi:ABC-type transport system involved in multi-copper enzyme maturation permease subunit